MLDFPLQMCYLWSHLLVVFFLIQKTIIESFINSAGLKSFVK